MTCHGTASIGSDQFAEFASAVVRNLPRDISPEQAQHLIEHQSGLKELLARAFSSAFLHRKETADSTLQKYVVHVHDDIDGLIAAGKYDIVEPFVREGKFSDEVSGKREVTVELLGFNYVTDITRASIEIDRLGFLPANALELFALGAEFPHIQIKHSIIALGAYYFEQRWGRCYPILTTDQDGKRKLGLLWAGMTISTNSRFAVVRK